MAKLRLNPNPSYDRLLYHYRFQILKKILQDIIQQAKKEGPLLPTDVDLDFEPSSWLMAKNERNSYYRITIQDHQLKLDPTCAYSYNPGTLIGYLYGSKIQLIESLIPWINSLDS